MHLQGISMARQSGRPEKHKGSGALRKAAEAKLAHEPALKFPSDFNHDHELQVYQIELEIQNEELRQAQLAMEESRDQYMELYEFAPVGYLTLDHSGLIEKANLTASKILGVERIKLINRRLASFLAPEACDRFHLHFQEILKSDSTQSCDLLLNSTDNLHKYVCLTCLRKYKVDQTLKLLVVFTDITMNKNAADEIQLLALYDELTRIPNRRLLLDRLKLALASCNRSGNQGALLFLDLDNFKTLNDTLGHDIGDLLLQQAAKRIESCVREGYTVARLGGDDFVVMLEELSDQPLEAGAQTEAVGAKILSILGQPYQLAGNDYHITISIGATLFNNQNAGTDELFKQADIAMYQSKKAGRNTLRFFDQKMQASINERATLERELNKAIAKGQFQLYYQIQVDSKYTAFGAEVLLRWIHPERGFVSPAQFIPLAEDTGQIIAIGNWALETACAQLKAWQEDAHTCELVLAVNVSAKQFRQTDFVSQVQAVVKRHAIDPKLLKLELTESMLVDDIENTIASMNTLRKFGIQFSLDDFGTGYSSLQYLKRLPLDQLKIDLSFVKNLARDTSDRTIVRTIIAMAQSLNINVIAEGVEEEEQRQILLNKGCGHFQGYLFSKPLAIGQFESLLKESKAKQAAQGGVNEPFALSSESIMRQRNQHLSAVLDSMPAMIGYWDKNLRNRFGNEAYASWFSVSPGKLLGMNLRDLLGEKLYKLNEPYIEGALRGERQEFERTIPTPDGKSQRHSLAEYIPDIVDGEVRGFYVHVADVSALKESTEKHRRAEEKFKALFESNQDAILLADKSGFYDCNQSALGIFECTTKAALFQSHPDSAFWSGTQAVFDFDAIVKSGKLDFESSSKKISSGESFAVSVHVSVIQLENGPNLQFVIRDITERKKFVMELEINKKVLDTTTDGFWLADGQGNILMTNQAYSTLVGFSTEELQHMHISQLDATEASREEVLAHVKRVIERGSDQFKTLHRHKDGHLIDIEVTTSYLKESQQFAVFSRDITERKQAEEALRDSEEMLRGLFDLSSLGFAFADMSGRFLLFNEPFRQICGYPEEELKCLDYWKLTPHKYLADEQLQMETFLRTGRFGPYEKEYIRKDGSLVPIRLTGMSITRKGGDKYIWTIVEDITLEKLREEELLSAIELTEAASKAKSTFLSTMSHELRTPMNGIMGMAQLLQMPDLSEAERQEFTTTLLDSGHEMLAMITSILEYAAIESNPGVLRLEVCTPGSIVSDCGLLMRHLAEKKGLTLEISTQEIDGHVYTLDSSRLHQMLQTLLENAVKFTEAGHIRIEARVLGTEGNTAELEFAVVDTGIGIPVGNHDLVFEAFTQVDGSSNRKFGGAGLGLATVKRLAQLMKGSVGVESEEGKGSRFWFTLKAQIN